MARRVTTHGFAAWSVLASAALLTSESAAAPVELGPVARIDLPNVQRVERASQRYAGLPVLGRGMTRRTDAAGNTLATLERVERVLPPSTKPNIRVEEAARAVRAHVPFPLGSGSLAVLPGPDGGRLVWRFEPRIPGLPAAPQALVDAQTGRVLALRDRAVRAARVYRSNPTKTPNTELLPFPIEPTTPERLTSDRIVAKSCVDKGTVLAFPGLPTGIRACELESRAMPAASGNYDDVPNDAVSSQTRFDDTFAEVSMFYHLGRVYSFFERLAPPGHTAILDSKPFTAVANLRIAQGLIDESARDHIDDPNAPLTPFSNAFFAPGGDGFAQIYGVEGGGLWFGQGPRRDYAYDGDVVYHEFAHAIVDATMGLGAYALDEQGLTAAPGALNEGIADFFAAALSGDPDVGEYSASDLHEGLPYVRTLANADRCPGTIVGEVHFDSTAFSGALWSARSTLSEVERVVFDRTLYEVLLRHPHYDAPTFEEMIELTLETFAERSSLAHRALDRELRIRGLWPRCERVLEATDRIIMAPTDAEGRIGFQAPGRFETGLPFSPGMITFRVSVATASAGPRNLSLEFQSRTRKTSIVFEPEGTPFTPVVLVQFDEPITYKGRDHGATELVGKDGQTSFVTPVPEGARVAYVQIANIGEKSGIYDAVKLWVTSTAGATANDAPGTPAVEAPASNEGCAIGRAQTTGVSMGALSLGALGFSLLARRRRR